MTNANNGQQASSFTFRCRCKGELFILGTADDALAAYQVWQLDHLHNGQNPAKTSLAIQAKGLQDEGKTLREIGELLGIGHPQSVKFLIERYT